MATATATDRQRMLNRLTRVLGAPLELRSAPRPADAIAVLGARLDRSGRVTPALAERVDAGVELWRRGLAEAVWMTGGGPPGRVEADAMAAHARQRGLPESALRLERRAHNTASNARNLAALLPPGARVWVVTQPFHLRRAVYWFRRAGLVPLGWHIAASVQYRSPAALRWILREYLALAAAPLTR